MLISLLACGGLKYADPPVTTDDTATVDTGDTFAPDDTLPLGDSLAPLGATSPDAGIDPVAIALLGGGNALICTASAGARYIDASDPTDVTAGDAIDLLLRPNDEACEHVASTGDGRAVLAHADPGTADWLILADVSDARNVVGRASWYSARATPGDLVADGDDLWLAANEGGLLRFDLSADTLVDPVEIVDADTSAVALSADRLAVGGPDGTVQILDHDGAVLGSLSVAGPVTRVAWAPDGTLGVACGDAGVDRVDVATFTVTAHADTVARDLAILGDGTFAVAAGRDVHLYEPTALALVGTEPAPTFADDAGMAAVATDDDVLYVAERTSVRTYRWDGSVSAPDIRIGTDTIAFGTATELTVTVFNDGPKKLTITGETSSDPAVTIADTRIAIEPRGSGELALSRTAGALDATLEIRSDDPDEGAITVPMTGE